LSSRAHLFGGVTDRLIPLYAVGAFLAFTLSQAGMVMHWRKNRGPGWVKSALVNGLGAFVTGTTTAVVLLARGNERIFTVSAPWYIGQQT
jgi:hypothetical protein